MSSELRAALKRAAPEPQEPFDEKAVSGRARRLRVWRGFTLVVAVLLVGGGIALATGDGPSTIPPAEHGDEPPGVPDGPRYEVMSGTFGRDWANDPGREWRLLVWGEGHTHCWQVATKDQPEHREGVACSAPAAGQDLDDEAFQGSMSFYTQSSDPDEFFFVAGVLSPHVEALEFRPDEGDPVDIEIADAPDGSGTTMRYYAATLPRFDRADLVAFDDQGQTLDTQHICGPGCHAERQRNNEATMAAWEAEPVTPMSKAAAFANLAVGAAELADLSGKFLAYEGIAPSGDGFRATFSAARCGPSEMYQCEEDLGSAYIDVAVQGRRLGRLEVTAVDGPLSHDERNELLSYVRGDDFGPRWEESQTSVFDGPDGRRAVMYSLVWMGNLPSPVADYGSLCRLAVFDTEGELIHEGRPIPTEVRKQEYTRVHQPMSELDSAVEVDVGETIVECDDPQVNLGERSVQRSS